jgi:hypothetical protein
LDNPKVSFSVGSLVRVRGREWIVQPQSEAEWPGEALFLILKPLGGADAETTGVYVPLEPVEPVQFALPAAHDLGDARSAGLLRDAVRLSFRSSAGPFRSFGRIAVEPRPYQLLPLLLALKQEVARILIADDVGIGKTIEAALIARELLDRGEVTRLAVLCPPHLAEQWQRELRDKFHLSATLVLPSTAARLERGSGLGESLFERYPFTIVSTDFIKAERRRFDFLRTAPELLIVDEAHTCADSGDGRGGRHQRHELLKGLAGDPARHLILVTATPHSGHEGAFRSLLALLNPRFAALPEELSGPHFEGVRRELAKHFVQRKRGDLRRYLEGTTFPERDDAEAAYTLSPEYKRLFARVLAYAREIVQTPERSHRQRVRWWSALGLLRALASSPAAAAATLRNRADTATAGRVGCVRLLAGGSAARPGEHSAAGEAPLTHHTRFPTVRSEGAILPPDLLRRIQEDRTLDSLTPNDYHLPAGTRLNEAVGRSWNALIGAWAAFSSARRQLPDSDPAPPSPASAGSCTCLPNSVTAGCCLAAP